ncbi:MAG: hypothetical protein ACR2JY_03090 [Chloroflexota bacterium]
MTLVTDTRGIFSSTLLPARIMLADYGRGGDSGALVQDLTTSNPATGKQPVVGIYIGAVTDQAGHTEGVAQHAFQAMQLMDMELYL